MQRSRELPVRWRFQIEKKSRSESSACRLRIAWGSSPCGFMSPIAPAACRWSVWLSPNQGPSLRAFEGGGGDSHGARKSPEHARTLGRFLRSPSELLLLADPVTLLPFSRLHDVILFLQHTVQLALCSQQLIALPRPERELR